MARKLPGFLFGAFARRLVFAMLLAFISVSVASAQKAGEDLLREASRLRGDAEILLRKAFKEEDHEAGKQALAKFDAAKALYREYAKFDPEKADTLLQQLNQRVMAAHKMLPLDGVVPGIRDPDRKEKNAARLLASAKTFERKNPGNIPAIADKYRVIADRYPRTAAGKEAAKRLGELPRMRGGNQEALDELLKRLLRSPKRPSPRTTPRSSPRRRARSAGKMPVDETDERIARSLLARMLTAAREGDWENAAGRCGQLSGEYAETSVFRENRNTIREWSRKSSRALRGEAVLPLGSKRATEVSRAPSTSAPSPRETSQPKPKKPKAPTLDTLLAKARDEYKNLRHEKALELLDNAPDMEGAVDRMEEIEALYDEIQKDLDSYTLSGPLKSKSVTLAVRGRPWVVKGTLTIPAGATLALAQGASLRGESGKTSRIVSNGTLQLGYSRGGWTEVSGIRLSIAPGPGRRKGSSGTLAFRAVRTTFRNAPVGITPRQAGLAVLLDRVNFDPASVVVFSLDNNNNNQPRLRPTEIVVREVAALGGLAFWQDDQPPLAPGTPPRRTLVVEHSFLFAPGTNDTNESVSFNGVDSVLVRNSWIDARRWIVLGRAVGMTVEKSTLIAEGFNVGTGTASLKVRSSNAISERFVLRRVAKRRFKANSALSFSRVFWGRNKKERSGYFNTGAGLPGWVNIALSDHQSKPVLYARPDPKTLDDETMEFMAPALWKAAAAMEQPDEPLERARWDLRRRFAGEYFTRLTGKGDILKPNTPSADVLKHLRAWKAYFDAKNKAKTAPGKK